MPAKRKDEKNGAVPRMSYSRALALEICKLVSDGLTIKQVSEIKGMPGRTAVYAWLADHADFANMYARAREERADLIADEIVGIADDEVDPNKARVRIDARKWWASKINPKVYGDKATVDVTSDNKHTHKVDSVSIFDAFIAEAIGARAEVDSEDPVPN